jgi:hypothetical protein
MDNKKTVQFRQLIMMMLMLLSCTAIAAPKKTTNVFVGKMNNRYEIHMRLDVEGSKVTGSYYYTSTFIPIYLEGTRNGNSVTLTEKVNDSITGTFKGSMVNNLYKGNWTTQSGKKLAFSLIKKDWIAPDTDNISGTYTYGMSKAEEKEAELPKGESGYSGTVSVMLQPDNKLGFCINYTKGYPNYNLGQLQGIAVPEGDGVYRYTKTMDYAEADQPCDITFSVKSGKLEIEQKTSDASCGFGAGVYVGGVYKKQSKTLDILNCLY